jgi:glyoxylase-like metal-dependent hydrolase (beta-lactamase superfamily II)
MPDRIELIRYELGPFMENAYLLVGPSGRKAALFDPGLDSEVILPVLEERNLELELIVNTHGHVDHVAGNAFFKERTGARLAIHPLDLPLLERLTMQGAQYGFEIPPSPPPDLELREGEPLLFDGTELEVLHTPGHSPGGTCLRFGGRMIVGDTLFLGSVGRTDLPGGSWPELLRSIREKLFRLPEDLVCYPGHGPETTIANERRHNPFVSDAAAGSMFSEPL